jgi:hypothetical protein
VNGLEAAIKNALARSDRTSAEVRARIYQSSREALEAGLRKQNIEDPELVAQHRQRLEQLIRLIEREERDRLLSLVAEHVKKTTPPAPEETGPTIGGVLRREPAFDEGKDRFDDHDDGVQPDAVQPPQPVNQRSAPAVKAAAPDIAVEQPRRAAPAAKAPTPPKPAPTTREEPRLGVDEQNDDFTADVTSRGYDLTNSPRDDDELAFKPEPIVVRKKRRGFFARMLVIFTLFAFMVMGAAWIYSSGVLISEEQRDQSVPNPPVEIQEEDFDGEDASTPPPAFEPDRQLTGSFSSDWLNVFDAGMNVGTARAGSQVTTENVRLPSGAALRVTSRGSSSGGDIQFEVPVELMRQLSGRASTIAVTLQSSTDTPTQVAIECDFKSLGQCSRHRFTAMPERSDLLINTTFTGGMVANAAGSISVNADIDGAGKSVNIYSVRILPSE